MSMPPRFAFVTIGQTPRTDLVPEIVRYLPGSVEVDEFGALDGMDGVAIAQLAPGPGQSRLVTRLRDGAQAIVGKEWVHRRIQELLDSVDPGGYTAVVLLCTGEFPGLRGPGLFLDAHALVDHGAAALCAGAKRIGLLLPLIEQAEDFPLRPEPGQELIVSHASPYAGRRFDDAGRELAEADVIVMHCMGYTQPQREVIAQVSGRPVLLARRLVAAALSNLL